MLPQRASQALLRLLVTSVAVAVSATPFGQVPPAASFPLPSSNGGISLFLDARGVATLRPGPPEQQSGKPVAWGSFDDTIEKTGWGVLDIHSSPEFSGEEQSYGAGYLEGYLTNVRMKQHQGNMWGIDFPGKPSLADMRPGARNFTIINLEWMKYRALKDGDHDPYWQQVRFMLEQLRGMTDGYNAGRYEQAGEPPITVVEVLMFSVIDMDMDDLLTAVVEHGKLVNSHVRHHKEHNVPAMLAEMIAEMFAALPLELRQRRHRGHCSALVQVTPGNQDILAGHVTWDEYRGMLHFMKYFDLPLPGVKARRMVFTSNPGSLYSGDDWYMTDAGLTIMETTITNYNVTAWGLVKPESMETWIRSQVAARLASNGDEFTEYQVRHQSGTCNNQWMVVDYKRFTPGEPIADGTLWVSETMPGYSRREDMSHVLRGQGSWPSYNVPYFPDVWKVAGYDAMQEEYPDKKDEYSFHHDTRARMFTRAREAGDVTDLDSFIGILRYNNYRNDPLAQGNGCNGISSRCDLNPQDTEEYDCFGAIDGKVASYRSNPFNMSFIAISGPTTEFQTERPFSWVGQNTSVKGCAADNHVGHPTTWDFPWFHLPDRVRGGLHFDEASTSLSTAGVVAGVSFECLLFVALVSFVVLARMAVGFRRRDEQQDGDQYVKIDA